MAKYSSYPQVDFKESQRFLARDPSRSEVVRVPCDSILDAKHISGIDTKEDDYGLNAIMIGAKINFKGG